MGRYRALRFLCQESGCALYHNVIKNRTRRRSPADMVFKLTLYGSLLIGILGFFYKVVTWFRCRVGDEARAVSTGERFRAAARGLGATIFSGLIFRLIRIAVLDIVFQRRIYRESGIRWLMHMSITYGFLGLLLLHALERFTLQKLFSEYYSTLDPFFTLRNVFGALMVLGLVLAVYRRLSDRVMRLTTRGTDVYALLILGVIGVSGFFLEAVKMVSYVRYEEMVQDYGSLADQAETEALRAYWAREYGVVFPGPPVPSEAGTLKKGEELHILNCAVCHAPPAGAFISQGLSRAIAPVALALTRARADRILWYVHFLACFLGLALLPFSKFFHILTSPLILLINGVLDRTRTNPANIATVRAIELDACTHCATCTQHCSVLPIYRMIPNPTILPSEKLGAYRSIVHRAETEPAVLAGFQEGASICTGCYRGTIYCPVGIVAQELWFCMGEDLAHRGCADLFNATRDRFVARFDWERKTPLTPLTPQGKTFQGLVGHSWQGNTFSGCYTCMTCTNACPVVRSFPNPIPELGLLPHQIMYSLKFGLPDQTLGARMVWDCLGCYQCQEGCPQGVRVADILFELKSMAFQQTKGRTPVSGLPGGPA